MVAEQNLKLFRRGGDIKGVPAHSLVVDRRKGVSPGGEKISGAASSSHSSGGEIRAGSALVPPALRTWGFILRKVPDGVPRWTGLVESCKQKDSVRRRRDLATPYELFENECAILPIRNEIRVPNEP